MRALCCYCKYRLKEKTVSLLYTATKRIVKQKHLLFSAPVPRWYERVLKMFQIVLYRR